MGDLTIVALLSAVAGIGALAFGIISSRSVEKTKTSLAQIKKIRAEIAKLDNEVAGLSPTSNPPFAAASLSGSLVGNLTTREQQAATSALVGSK